MSSREPELFTQESVLLDSVGLKKANRMASDLGRKPVTGLYHGKERYEDEVEDDQKFKKVDRAYQQRQAQRVKRGQRQKKTVEQVEDEDAAKKAKAILEKATDQEKLMYRELFELFDTNGDRSFGSIEFAQHMTDIGCDTSIESAANLLYFAGVRNVDRITYDDFVQLMPKLKSFRILLEKEAMHAFAAQDTQGNGFISRSALREVIFALAGPEGIPEEQVHYLIKKSDRERTGRIPFNYFIKAMLGSPPTIVYVPKKRKGIIATLFGCGASHQSEDGELKFGRF